MHRTHKLQLTCVASAIMTAAAAGSLYAQENPKIPTTAAIAQTTAMTTLTASPTRVVLSDSSLPDAPRKSLSVQLRSLQPQQRLFLVLHDLSADAAPGTLFHIFLDLPESAAPNVQSKNPHLVGNLNFFAFVKPPSDAARPSTQKHFRSYDITALARHLQKNNLLTKQTTITFIPNHAPDPAANPAIAQIEITIQSDASPK